MKNSKNVKTLRLIMTEHKLTRRDVSTLLSMSISSIDAWLSPNSSARHRKMPDRMLELLKLKIKEY